MLERLSRLAMGRLRDPGEAEAWTLRTLGQLEESPAPQRALAGLERWAGALVSPGSTFALLLEHPRLLADLLYLFGASPFLTDILVRDPELYTILAGPAEAGAVPDYGRLVEATLRPLRRLESRRAALRRLKRREFLRIAWLDLLGHASLAQTVAAVSGLADALIGASLSLAEEELRSDFPTIAPQVSLAVIGMGKLGGQELNYSSDVDLLVVFDSPAPRDSRHLLYARRAAERVVCLLHEETAEGRLFRVDMRLRPEGRYGELVRSVDSYRDYYDRWVETWERQALIKARPVAGCPELADRFMRLATATAYGRGSDPSLPEDVRDMRLMLEQRTHGAARTLNVKEGRGTIREVEFVVQLLQLMFGEREKPLRQPGTLPALAALRRRGLLDPGSYRDLLHGYRFFRTVEHRLQIEEDLPVRHLPAAPESVRRLALLMGYRDSRRFLAACERRAGRVRAVCDGVYARLGALAQGGEEDLRPWLLSLESADARHSIGERLAAMGFAGVQPALESLERLAVASGSVAHSRATRRAFAALGRPLLEACARSADPEAALAGFQRLADRAVLHRAFYQRFLDEPAALEDLCLLLGASPRIGALLERFPEYLDRVLDTDALAPNNDLLDLQFEFDQRLVGAATHGRRLSQLRRFRLRHLLRLAAREILERADAESIVREWSDVAQVCLQGALRAAIALLQTGKTWPAPDAAGFAVVGLGRLGGRELHFCSDLDLVYVFEPRGLAPADYETLARALEAVVRETTAEGQLFEIDLRLRPEGKQGFIVSSVDAFRRYFAERAQSWERQVFLKARCVAGCPETAATLLDSLAPQICPPVVEESWTDEVRRMKARIERERLRSGERQRNVKLAPGGLSDVEFLAQWLQRRHCGRCPELRATGTLEALQAVSARSLLPEEETSLLVEAYRWLTRLRQRLWLTEADGSADALPGDPRELLRLARSLRYESGDALLEDCARRARAVRATYERYLGSERMKDEG